MMVRKRELSDLSVATGENWLADLDPVRSLGWQASRFVLKCGREVGLDAPLVLLRCERLPPSQLARIGQLGKDGTCACIFVHSPAPPAAQTELKELFALRPTASAGGDAGCSCGMEY